MELKPCPFCGGEATLEYDGARKGTHAQSCIVKCLECGCALECSEEGDFCGGQWNTRKGLYIRDTDELLQLIQSARYADDGRHYALFQKMSQLFGKGEI